MKKIDLQFFGVLRKYAREKIFNDCLRDWCLSQQNESPTKGNPQSPLHHIAMMSKGPKGDS